ncbi:MAG: MerR family transcriptional regulator [Colwellia sp.]
MKTKEITEKTGLSRDTIRFYEKENLIPSPSRSSNGYRFYDEQVVTQLKMITRAKELGFTLKEIKELTKLLYSKGLTKKKMSKQLELKNLEIDRKVFALKKIKEEINKALEGMCDYKEHLK